MNALHQIATVARYEAKTLFRSWFFRIFAILALAFVVLFNIGTQTSVGFPSGDMVSLPSMIPFFNLYIINIAQAVIAVFLASDFLRRDKKLDTTEVIYMRSMTNTAYVTGKTIGNVWVFFMLNFVALAIVAIFNMASPYNQFRALPYLYYFLLISVPTLIYILGLSFFLMSVIKNQAVTFILLLGYIAATLFYLQTKFHFLFDYMAFHLPMTWSDFTGFGFLQDILIHRGIYLFLGLGFIGLTILLLKRLSQSNTVKHATLVFTVTSILIGATLAYKYINAIEKTDQNREAMIALNNEMASKPVVQVKKHNIELHHFANRIEASSKMLLVNENGETMSELVLTLNPGLRVSKVDGATFSRTKQIIVLQPSRPLAKGDSIWVNITYEGAIDESFCYLDMSRERLEKWLSRGNGIVDKKYAFLNENYLLLTPETGWYPVPGIRYSSEGLNWLNVQFTDFTLRVRCNKQLKAISQGQTSSEGDFTIFRPEQPLTQISLAIGDYQSKTIDIDGINYSLHYLKGHNTFEPYFKELADSVAPVIRDLRKSWEVKIRMEYPFKRLQLVETPIQFSSFNHVWTNSLEQVQPETIYLSEGGFRINGANFPLAKRMSERMNQRNNETITQRETEEGYLKRFVNEALLTSSSNSFGGNRGFQIQIGGPNTPVEEQNPYFIFANYFNFVTPVSSPEYPITNRVFEAYLSKSGSENSNPWMRNFTGLTENEKGNIALQERSFTQLIEEQSDPDILDNVISTKSGFLFSLMKGAIGPEKFDEFIYPFLEERQFTVISVDELNQQLASNFGLDLNRYMPNWYNSKKLPGYLITNITAVNIQTADQIKTKVSFVLSNSSEIDGAVEVVFRLGGGSRGGGPRMFMMGGSNDDVLEKTVAIGARQSKRVSYILNQNPRMMTINTFASGNIPSSITQRFDKIEIDPKAYATEGEEVIPFFNGIEPNEIIVDTEDPGFSLEQPESASLIRRIFTPKPSDNEMKYKGMNMWNPAVDWTLITNDQFYGSQIRSAYYCKSGSGDHKATWSIPVTSSGYYKAYVYIPKIRGGRGGNDDRSQEYTFKVIHDDGEDLQTVDISDSESGWFEVGSYHFSADAAKIELNNQAKTRSVFADAVKLVKEN